MGGAPFLYIFGIQAASPLPATIFVSPLRRAPQGEGPTHTNATSAPYVWVLPGNHLTATRGHISGDHADHETGTVTATVVGRALGPLARR